MSTTTKKSIAKVYKSQEWRLANHEPEAQKREIFILDYLTNGLDGPKAAEKAGYAPRALKTLLDHPEVRLRLSQYLERVGKYTPISIGETLSELARIGYSDIRKIFNADGTLKNISELDDFTASSVSSIEVNDELDVQGSIVGRKTKVKMHDKNKALDTLMKYLGLYEKDNKQKNQVNLNFNFAGRETVNVVNNQGEDTHEVLVK